MANNRAIALYIQDTQITALLASLGEDRRLTIDASAHGPCQGLHSHGIADRQALQQSIHHCLISLRHSLDQAIVLLNCPPQWLRFHANQGIHIIKDPSRPISEEDTAQCLQLSRNIVKPAGHDILHHFPFSFSVDQVPVSNPIGTFGQSLDIHTQIVTAPTELLQCLPNMVQALGFNQSHIIANPLIWASGTLSSLSQTGDSILIHLGDSATHYALYHQGQLVDIDEYPIGEQTMINHCAKTLSIDTHHAEQLVRYVGQLNPLIPPSHDPISIPSTAYPTISRHDVNQLIVSVLTPVTHWIQQRLQAHAQSASIHCLHAHDSVSGLSEWLSHALSQPIHPMTSSPPYLTHARDMYPYAMIDHAIRYQLFTPPCAKITWKDRIPWRKRH